MKKKLPLILALLLFAVTIQAQTTVYEVPDIFICNDDTVDLTQQTTLVLGDQDPESYFVTYYHSLSNAEANVNPIDEPEFYSNGMQTEQIFVRVTSIADGSYAVNSFLLSFTFTNVDVFADFYVCGEAFALPPLQYGNYYTQPGGGGTMLNAGDVFFESQTIYIYNQNEEVATCTAESDFEIVITEMLEIDPVEPLIACDEDLDGYAVFDLGMVVEEVYSSLANQPMDFYISVYQSETDAANGVNPIAPGQAAAYTNIMPYQQTLYLRIYAAGGECWQIMPFSIVAANCGANVLEGTVMYDIDGNGCDENDIPATGLTVVCTNNGYTYYSAVDADGSYDFNYLYEGENIITVAPDAYIDFTASPSQYTITTPAVESDLDFCLQSEDVNDVLVWLMPTSTAIPGFETTYTLMYANYGTLPSSGVISLTFDDSMLTFDSAAPAMQQNGNVLSVSYNNLQPFATQYAYITFTVMQPPTVNMGDILEFEAVIDAEVDDNFTNNTYSLSQLVINSFDPNDITVREGAFITPEQAEGYLHYTIRFQNEGTANAQKVRIETTLDNNLDWDTFMPMQASHSYEIVRNGATVEFIFDDIDLPFTDADEAGSQGYIIYKVKPVATIAEGDVMEASAGIFFDFNEAVLTNTATTTVQTAASNETFTDSAFTVYPNPASGNITLKMDNLNGSCAVTVTDVLGKTVMTATAAGNETNLNIAELTSGMYFITLDAGDKKITKKIMVR